MEQQYLNEQDVSKLTGRALSTLRNDRHMGRGFCYVKLGRSVRYLKSDVLDFMESCKIQPRHDLNAVE